MKMIVVNMNAVVSHCTCVAFMSNSAIMVGNAVMRRNWLNVSKKAAAMITTTTPLLCTFSSDTQSLLIGMASYTLLHTGRIRSKCVSINVLHQKAIYSIMEIKGGFTFP